MIKAIDFFCGAGGASAGLVLSRHVQVVAAVNHDPRAIECHEQNHPDVDHYNIDVREIDHVMLAEKYPDTQLLWWSAECTHFSIAKGGQSRDADSRMLNEELYRFVDAINPDRIMIENVREFRTWGPLDENGKPIKERKGEYYFRWIRRIESMGYHYEDRDLNAADYGARTSRVRLFGVFAKKDIEIKWPRQTHAKDPAAASLLNPEPLKPWRAVGPVLDLDNWGDSIFHREKIGKKPLSPKTISRIEYGLNKYFPDPNGVPYVLRVASEEEIESTPEVQDSKTAQFLFKYHGNGKNTIPLNEPASTITTKDRLGLCTAQYIMGNYSRKTAVSSLDHPLPTICAGGYSNIMTPLILPYNYGNMPAPVNEPLSTIMAKRDKYLLAPIITRSSYDSGSCGIDQPCPTILASRRHHNLVVGQFIEKQYNGKENVQRIEDPAGTITTVPKLRLVSGLFVDYRIKNVFMRMLTVPELLAAQGFPADYKMPKSSTLAKKFIGNSVPPTITELLTHAQFGTESQRIAGVREYSLTA